MRITMKKRFLLIKITAIFLAITFLCSFTIKAKKESELSWVILPGSSRLTPAFPDKCSTYAFITFKTKTGDFDLVKLTGEFPHARYFSFTTYDSNQGTDLAAILDQDIKPDQGNINPFIIGVNRTADKRNYTIWLVKEGVSPPDESNFMIIPANVESLLLGLRIYRPDNGTDSFGNVNLPKIEFLKKDLTIGVTPDSSFNLAGILKKIPILFFNKELIESWKIGRYFNRDNIVFYRVSDEGYFPNSHNEYLSAILPQFYYNKIAVVTFKPPTFEDTYNNEKFQGGKDVRYWSICTGGLGATATPDCLCDDQIRLNSNGTVTICIAPEYMKKIIENAGFNYMKWGVTYKPILIYRQLVANESFYGNINKVPKIGRPPSPENRTEEYFNENRAENFIGDYCPTGKIYSVLEFISWLKKQ